MNKKINRRQLFDASNEAEESGDNSMHMLHTIQKKLDASAALNGGFDRLLYKIDGIEKSQGQIVEKVDKIHEAIYHPDDGLFARIAATKATQSEAVGRVEKQITDLTQWKQEAENAGEDCEKETDELQNKLQSLESSIQSIEKFQAIIMSGLKWSMAGIGGAIMTVLFKVLYNAIKTLP